MPDEPNSAPESEQSQDDQMMASLQAAIEAHPATGTEVDDTPPENTPKAPEKPAPAAKPAAKEPEGDGIEPKAPPAPAPKGKTPPETKPAAGETKPAAGETKPAAPDAKKPPAATKPDADELTEEQINALKPGRGASKADVASFERMRSLIKAERARRVEAENKATQYEKSGTELPVLATEVETLRKRNAELEQYEFLVNPEKSGKIEREYAPKLQTAEQKVIGALQAAGIDEARIEAIKKRGVGAFTREQWTWGDKVWGTMKPHLRRDLEKSIDVFFETIDERDHAIKSAATDREAYEKAEQEKVKKQSEAYTEEFIDEIQKIQDEHPEFSAIPDEELKLMKGDDLKAALAKNKFHKEVLKPLFEKATAPENYRDVARNGQNAVLSYLRGIWLDEKNAEIEKLQEQIAAFEAKEGKRKVMQRIPGSLPSTAPRIPTRIPTAEESMAAAIAAHPSSQ